MKAPPTALRFQISSINRVLRAISSCERPPEVPAVQPLNFLSHWWIRRLLQASPGPVAWNLNSRVPLESSEQSVIPKDSIGVLSVVSKTKNDAGDATASAEGVDRRGSASLDEERVGLGELW